MIKFREKKLVKKLQIHVSLLFSEIFGYDLPEQFRFCMAETNEYEFDCCYIDFVIFVIDPNNKSNCIHR